MSPDKHMRLIAAVLALGSSTALIPQASAQSGAVKNSGGASASKTIPVFIHSVAPDSSKPKIGGLLGSKKKTPENSSELNFANEDFSLIDAGIEQKIGNISRDSSAARYVVLLDNSEGFLSDAKTLAAIPAAFGAEIYEGDQVMTIAYGEKPELIHDFTDKPEELSRTFSSIRFTGKPQFVDALDVAMEDVFRPLDSFSKRIIIAVTDGLDKKGTRKTSFARVLSTLANENVIVYAFQAKDRTDGVVQRDNLTPPELLVQLVNGTGGRTFPLEPESIKENVKLICDEVRENLYRFSYTPKDVPPPGTKRSILITSPGKEDLELRYKAAHGLQ